MWLSSLGVIERREQQAERPRLQRVPADDDPQWLLGAAGTSIFTCRREVNFGCR